MGKELKKSVSVSSSTSSNDGSTSDKKIIKNVDKVKIQ